jgi:hypothetical protein
VQREHHGDVDQLLGFLVQRAVVVGGVTLAATLFASPPSESPRRGSAGSTRVVLGPGAVRLDGTF